MKFKRWSLRHVDSLVMIVTHCCPVLVPDDSTRVMLQGKEDYINASHITVRCASLMWNTASCHRLTFVVNSSSVWYVCVCLSVCVRARLVRLFVRLLDGAPSVWCMFTLCCGSGSVATDLHSLLADCVGAADTHHHHAYNSDREGTGIHTCTRSRFHTVNSFIHPGEGTSKQSGLQAHSSKSAMH